MRKETQEARQIARTRAITSKIEQASPGLNLAVELGFRNTSSESDIEIEEMATQNQNNRTLKELAAPNLKQQPLCIEYPNMNVAFKLKSGLIHSLPTLHGLTGEDSNKHLKEFYEVCSSIKPTGVTEEYIKL